MTDVEEAIEAAAPSPAALRRTGLRAGLRRVLLRAETASLAAFVGLFIAFSLITTDLFLAKPTFVSIASLAADIGIVSIGVTLLMIGGHFDLSVGSVVGLSSFVGVSLVSDLGLPAPFAIIGTLVAAALIGLVNGIIVVATRLHSFIVTLGTLLWARGLLLWASAGQPQSLSLPDSFVNIVAGPKLWGFRMSLLWFAVLAAVGSVLLYRTRLGNWIFAAGNNPEGARDLGVPVKRVTVSLFVMSSIGAGVIGVIQAARFDSVDPQRGQGIELLAIAAVVIGGTLLTGGFGSVLGTAIGAFVFATIQVGLILSGVPGFWFNTTVGILLVLAVLLNSLLAQFVLRAGGRGPIAGSTLVPEPVLESVPKS